MDECERLRSLLCEYLEGGCEELRAHVDECRTCRVLVDTTQVTVELCASLRSRLPVEVEERLLACLREKKKKPGVRPGSE